MANGQPSNPDDMSLPQMRAISCLLSILTRIRQELPKVALRAYQEWHPDRFETKSLRKVVEDEREKAKHEAGNVARYLGDLLRNENENNKFCD